MQVAHVGFNSATSIQPHAHHERELHEFHYFTGGSGTFWNNGIELTVEPGALFLSRPRELHRATSRSGVRFQLYWLLFSPTEDPDGLFPRLSERFDDGAKIVIGKGQATTFEDIRRRWASSDPLVKRSADYRFAALLCDLTASNPKHDASGSVRYVDEAMGLMQSSLHEPVGLEAIAERLGIDKAYFIRLFKRHVGVSPMRYFLDLRLDSAKYRLVGGDENLRTIAQDLGFHDEFHFSHQFKAHVGVSPQAFKAQTVPAGQL